MTKGYRLNGHNFRCHEDILKASPTAVLSHNIGTYMEVVETRYSTFLQMLDKAFFLSATVPGGIVEPLAASFPKHLATSGLKSIHGFGDIRTCSTSLVNIEGTPALDTSDGVKTDFRLLLDILEHIGTLLRGGRLLYWWNSLGVRIPARILSRYLPVLRQVATPVYLSF
jgi:hypothetical protein